MNRSDCPVSCTLDVIGDKWSLVIIRDALFRGSTTYGEFQASPEKIATNILASRLSKMVEHGIMEKHKDPDNKLRIHYRLTEKGKDLKDVIVAVGLWGNKYLEGTCDIQERIEQAEKAMQSS